MAKLPRMSVLIAAAFGLGFIGSAALNVQQYQRAQQDKKLLQGQITDLRYQLNIDKALGDKTALAPTPSPTPSLSPTATPEPSPVVAGTASFQLSDFGVKFTTSEAISDVTHTMVPNGIYSVAGLTTASLVAKYPGCAVSKTNNALGQIARKTTNQSSGVAIKKLGDYYYFYIKPNGFCSDDPAAIQAITNARAAVFTSMTDTIAL